ncbi:hypothetical protein GIS00_17555 [Nakamurella sp. YIM 132087]|uniref:Peptidase S51 n=1 Tax=Nakamurella alba TaxID=2665158 RepID=A0A7K1FR79_9ACTN|nr:hypothetical protein [Nakamurella alba]MTD15743.1 hypothetical protein [Nakamurella alba]
MSGHLIGGGWDPQWRDAVWGPFVADARDAAGGAVPRIACAVFDEGDGSEQFRRWADVLTATADCTPVPVLFTDVVPEEALRTVEAADALLVCGGLTPAYAAALAPVADRLRVFLGTHPYAGFSAGAAIAAGRAVVGGWVLDGRPVCPEDAGEDLDELSVVDGLGLLGPAVDVHAAQWGTLGRLVAAAAAGLVGSGVAIDENTALRPDGTVVGAGRVTLVRSDESGEVSGLVSVAAFMAGQIMPGIDRG